MSNLLGRWKRRSTDEACVPMHDWRDAEPVVHTLPGSLATVEPDILLPNGLIWTGIIRCSACHRRLLDLQPVGPYAPGSIELGHTALLIRACPICGAKNERAVTTVRGRPVGADDELWYCAHCNARGRSGYLGRIEAATGRVALKCSRSGCHRDVRFVAQDAWWWLEWQNVKRAA